MTVLISLLLTASPQALVAKEAKPKRLTVGGRWLMQSASLSELPLGIDKNGEAVSAAESQPGTNHFRAQVQGPLARHLELDLALDLYEWASPGTEDLNSNDLHPFDLRRLSLSWTTPYGRLKLGRVENRWGLGMVAGGRNASPSWTHAFAHPGRGDNVLILAYGAKLGAVSLGLAGQQVLGDENAHSPVLSVLSRDLTGQDEAYQGVAVVKWSPDAKRSAGAYGVYRQQRDADGSFLNVLLLDATVDWQGSLGLADRWRLALEGALVTGSTNRMHSEASLNRSLAQGLEPEDAQLDLNAFGLAAVAGLGLNKNRLNMEFEAGYASGDANGEDKQLNRFSFDAQYGVGMVLVPWFWRSLTEETVRRASDSSLSGLPPKGIGYYRSRGAVSGLTYINPRVSLSQHRNKGMALHLALLVVGLPEGSADPFWTFRRAAPTNPFGGATDSHLLGSELDLGLTFTNTHRKGRYASRFALELAVASPGAAMADAGGQSPDTLWMGRVAFDLRAKELFQ